MKSEMKMMRCILKWLILTLSLYGLSIATVQAQSSTGISCSSNDHCPEGYVCEGWPTYECVPDGSGGGEDNEEGPQPPTPSHGANKIGILWTSWDVSHFSNYSTYIDNMDSWGIEYVSINPTYFVNTYEEGIITTWQGAEKTPSISLQKSVIKELISRDYYINYRPHIDPIKYAMPMGATRDNWNTIPGGQDWRGKFDQFDPTNPTIGYREIVILPGLHMLAEAIRESGAPTMPIRFDLGAELMDAMLNYPNEWITLRNEVEVLLATTYSDVAEHITLSHNFCHHIELLLSIPEHQDFFERIEPNQQLNPEGQFLDREGVTDEDRAAIGQYIAGLDEVTISQYMPLDIFAQNGATTTPDEVNQALLWHEENFINEVLIGALGIAPEDIPILHIGEYGMGWRGLAAPNVWDAEAWYDAGAGQYILNDEEQMADAAIAIDGILKYVADDSGTKFNSFLLWFGGAPYDVIGINEHSEWYNAPAADALSNYWNSHSGAPSPLIPPFEGPVYVPVAKAGADQTVIDEDGNGVATITLDGSTSTDDIAVTSYSWSDENGVIATEAIVSLELAVGTYTYTLTVEDADGNVDTDKVIIVVSESLPNQNPVAVSTIARATDTDNNGVESVTLNASESTDDGTIVSYVWTLDGTEIGTGVSITEDFTVGTHIVELTVTDDEGAVSSTTTTVIVDPFNASRMDRILVGNQSLFLSGGNLAWYNFANDFGEKTTNLEYYEQAISDFATRGGNSMRLWVHINGANNPELDASGYTSGLEPSMIQDLRDVLDIAYDHNVVLNLCLWSFDMLNTRDYPTEVSQRAKKLLENEENIDAYINNALIPMVSGLKDHEALLSWEIFNEPEGMSNEFGWDFTDHVPMSTIQRFINRLSGAIHREDPEAKVTNGAWSFKANSDIFSGVEKNYYSDAELIAAGGDVDGTLDYYQVHYYSWAGTTYSPFVHPASHWELDKPLVMGEFYVEDQPGSIAEEDLFEILYNNGYAGAWGWQYRTYDDGDNTDEIHRDAMLAGVVTLDGYPDIAIDPNRNHRPTIIGTINSFRTDKDAATLQNYLDLNTIFFDPEGTNLNYTVETSPSNVVIPSVDNGMLTLAFADGATADVTVTVIATDSGTPAASNSIDFVVSVNEPGTGNLALYQTVSASSVEEGPNTAESVNDGDLLTRWSSLYEDPSWIAVAFDQEYSVNEVKIYWEGSYSSQYEIQVSQDGTSWNSVYTNNAGTGGEDIITFPAVNAKHIRMYGIQRAIEWGHSIYEFEVYGDVPKSISANAGADQFLNDHDGNGSEMVTLNGTASTDAEQTIVTYEWTENGASIASGATADVELGVGDHNITLTVTNDLGVSSTDHIKVKILPAGCTTESTPLVSNWSLGNEWSDQNNGSNLSNAGGALVLNHRMWGKTDIWLMQTGIPLSITQGEPVNVAFDFSAASTPSVTSMSVALISSFDNEGPVDVIQSGINVDGPFETGFNSYSIDFTAEETSNEAYLAFYLVFDTQPNAEVTYALKNLTVCTGTVNVNTAPIANAGIDQSVEDIDQNGFETISLDGSSSSDLEGAIASYCWTLNGAEIATGVNPSVELAVGTHQITLTVTDNEGLTDTDEVTVSVEEVIFETSLYEAENASLTSVSVESDATASEGAYVHMQGDGSITWTFNASTAGTQTINIGYLLPHGNKNQYVSINGNSLGSILFDGPTNAWLEKSIDVEVVTGNNTVTINKHWGYMYFDYLSVGSGSNSRAVALVPEITADEVSIYPNPATTEFTVAVEGFESMIVYDLKGIALINSNQPTAQVGALGTGIYLVRVYTTNGIKNIRLSVR
ncbi:PKD domain-containing protein [Flammeovirga agarivorans]|uniref:T9SS type A sorting domain-containing protein n=1 Tax=Flammeovirga agarivorans TaxID=2726742 RepID=A0A7X8SNI9_9BACT|nr:PKD domain-containing protein [Flammeovirga agarivorans]NLR93397.1 T9SS type A sorting domain-containing protein [Flammeovirga agarivorans]